MPNPEPISFLKQHPAGATLEVHVVPGSSRSKVGGPYNQRLKIFLAAPPERGRANELLIEVLAEFFGCAPGRIEIQRGHTSKQKTVLISLPIEEIRRRLDGCKNND